MFEFRSAAHPIAMLLTALALAVAVPAGALAAGDPLRECTQQGAVAAGHSAGELRAALAHLPADVDEYTDCRHQLERAMRALTVPTPQPNGKLPQEFTDESPTTTPLEVPTTPAALAHTVDANTGTVAGIDAVDGAPAQALPAKTDRESAGAPPIGDRVGSLAAAGIVVASLLALGRPAMLRRRRGDEE